MPQVGLEGGHLVSTGDANYVLSGLAWWHRLWARPYHNEGVEKMRLDATLGQRVDVHVSLYYFSDRSLKPLEK